MSNKQEHFAVILNEGFLYVMIDLYKRNYTHRDTSQNVASIKKHDCFCLRKSLLSVSQTTCFSFYLVLNIEQYINM